MFKLNFICVLAAMHCILLAQLTVLLRIYPATEAQLATLPKTNICNSTDCSPTALAGITEICLQFFPFVSALVVYYNTSPLFLLQSLGV